MTAPAWAGPQVAPGDQGGDIDVVLAPRIGDPARVRLTRAYADACRREGSAANLRFAAQIHALIDRGVAELDGRYAGVGALHARIDGGWWMRVIARSGWEIEVRIPELLDGQAVAFNSEDLLGLTAVAGRPVLHERIDGQYIAVSEL